MTKHEAIQAMKEGQKVKHHYFSAYEYIWLSGKELLDERGINLPWLEFWAHRNTEVWQDGWSIY